MSTISQILEEIGWKFFIANWVPHELSADWRRTEWTFVKRCWRFWKSSIHDKRIALLQVINAGLIRIIIIADNGQ
jgi:hypothetical protein